MKKINLILFSIFDVFLIIPIILIIASIVTVQTRYSDRIQMVQTVQPADVIMVLGASIESDGVPSKELEDRLNRGIELFNEKAAPLIFITGDDGENNSDEISTMKQFLIDHDIPEQKILTDPHGYRTYESCKRAKEVFEIKEIILVTQQFHINRALYLCNELGIDAQGVTSDLQDYDREWYNIMRDLLASVKAYIDMNFLPPEPPVKYVEKSEVETS